MLCASINAVRASTNAREVPGLGERASIHEDRLPRIRPRSFTALHQPHNVKNLLWWLVDQLLHALLELFRLLMLVHGVLGNKIPRSLHAIKLPPPGQVRIVFRNRRVLRNVFPRHTLTLGQIVAHLVNVFRAMLGRQRVLAEGFLLCGVDTFAGSWGTHPLELVVTAGKLVVGGERCGDLVGICGVLHHGPPGSRNFA